MVTIKNLDSVALLQPLPAESLHLIDERYDLSDGLAAGTVGTIVEIHPPSSSGPLHYVVEFADGQGCGYASPLSRLKYSLFCTIGRKNPLKYMPDTLWKSD